MEKPKSSNRLSCGSGVAVSVGVGVVYIIAKVGVATGRLVAVGDGIAVATEGDMVGVLVGAGVISLASGCGVAVGAIGASGLFEQAVVPVAIIDRIRTTSNREATLFPELKDRKFIWACSSLP